MRRAAYGAAAKGITFLNFLGPGAETFLAVADRNPHKQGRLLPGTPIPVVRAEALAPLRAHGAGFAVASAEAQGGLMFL